MSCLTLKPRREKTMAQWKIKELSDMTDVSVRMLRHYDKLELLKPSGRTSSGYRWYSEQDLARLQQIIALKYFGFGLEQIKTMLKHSPGIYEHLQAQQQMLEDQTEHLRRVQDALAKILEQGKDSDGAPFDWNTLVSLIERYRMVDKLKGTWAEKLNDKQKEHYIKFKQACLKEVTAWDEAITQINSGQLGDPEGPDGQRIIDVFSKLQKAQLAWEAKTKVTHKVTRADADELLETISTFKTKGIPLSPEGNAWFAKALAAHQLRSWEKLHQGIIKNLEEDPAGWAGEKLAKQWRELLTDQCAGAPNDFFLGFMLIMDSVRNKVIQQNPEAAQQLAQEMTKAGQDLKLLQDPMAIDWIMKALKAH